MELSPLLAAAHTRLAAAEFLRVDYDPDMPKPSKKDERKAALELCEVMVAARFIRFVRRH